MVGVRVGGGRGMERKGKRTRGHRQQCGDYGGGGDIRGLNGDGKHTINFF